MQLCPYNSSIFYPVIPSLSELSLKFICYNKKRKELFDFQGGDHVLMFSIKCLKQSLKYSKQ